MEIDDEATVAKQRRNVVVIATGLLIFYLAGGELKRVPIPNDWVTFSHPGVFLGFAWLALAYSLLRFLQHSMPLLSGFGADFTETTNSDSGIREYLWRRVARGRKFPDSARDSYIGATRMQESRAFARTERLLKVQDSGSSTVSIETGNGARIPLLAAWYFETKQFAREALLSPAILELWFPFFLSFVAVMVALFQSFVLTASPWTRLLDRLFY